ncbi:MAG: hypothetical protein LBU39_02510 [Desulfobulbaceae bacterium]|jgi:hypothetical protein|nr:hypothetical protein [Desulfobulbaceae bacterium]
MIVSAFAGRLRLRDAALKNPRTIAEIERVLANQSGVTTVAANRRTGGLLVRYNPATRSEAQVLAAVAPFLSDATNGVLLANPRRSPGRRARHGENLLLAWMYAITGVSGFIDKRVHLAASLALTILAARHALKRLG